MPTINIKTNKLYSNRPHFYVLVRLKWVNFPIFNNHIDNFMRNLRQMVIHVLIAEPITCSGATGPARSRTILTSEARNRGAHRAIAFFMDLRLVVYPVFSYSSLLAKHNRGRGRGRYRNRNRGTKDGIWTRERNSGNEATQSESIPIPIPTPTPMGTRSRRIANNWLQASAKPRLSRALISN